MPNPRYSKQHRGGTGGFSRQLGKRYPSQQRILNTGAQRDSIARIENRIAKWDAGTAELELEFAKVRAKNHRFVPMGRLPACELCGSNRDDLRENGTRIHTGGE